MNSLIHTLYERIVIRRPAMVLLGLVCVALFFSLHVDKFKLDASPDSILLEDDEDLRIFRETNERYATQDFLFVTFTPKAKLFSDDSLSTIGELKADLEKLQKTDSVLSLVDVPLLKIVGGKLSEVAENFKTLAEDNVDKDKAREELLASPIFSELIISKDAQTTALMVNLKNDTEYLRLQKLKNRLLIKQMSETLSTEEEQELSETLAAYDKVKSETDIINHENIKSVRAILDKYKNKGDLHLGGISMIADDMITFIRNDLILFGTGIFAFLVLLLSIIFRQLRWVVLPLLSCIFAGLVMVGLLGLVGWRVTVISSNFISLMLILTMSMNVHLIVRYRQLRAEMADADQSQLVLETTRKMVWPCLYTALTTMIGFSSLVFSGIKPVIDFGWMMTLGLAVTFLTSFLLFPAVLLFLEKSDKDVNRSDSVPMTAALASITQHHGNKVLIISVLLAIISVVGITKLKVENSFINYFSDSTEIYQGLKLIDDKLGGTTPLEIILKFQEEEDDWGDEEGGDEFEDMDALFGEIESDPSDTFFTSDKLDIISEVHDYLDNINAVGKVLSLTSVLRLAQELNEGQPFDAFELAVINKRMPADLKKSLLDPYISIENNEARVSLRILDSLKDLRRKELLDQIHADLTGKIGLAEDEFQITGLLVLYNNMLQSLFKSQIKTMGVVMLGIALMLLFLFRSVTLAVIGIVPNILAAGIILGIMGLANIPLDMMTITIAAITIGIAVDNSIHYIYRFREEYPKNGDYIETLNVCHANIGRAVFYTAITIIVGFSILILSNFIPTIYFGLLTALAMFIALLAALTLLPKLILMFRPF